MNPGVTAMLWMREAERHTFGRFKSDKMRLRGLQSRYLRDVICSAVIALVWLLR